MKRIIYIFLLLVVVIIGCKSQPEQASPARELNIPTSHIGTFSNGTITVRINSNNILIELQQGYKYDIADMYLTTPLVENLEGYEYSVTFAGSGYIFDTSENANTLIFTIKTNGINQIYFLDRV